MAQADPVRSPIRAPITGERTDPSTNLRSSDRRYFIGRRGLTAETVIGALEDAQDYKAFEAAIIADYDAQSVVERELVLRLASLLWRLRRATTMETGLFDIQADHLAGLRQPRRVRPGSREVVYALFRRTNSVSFDPDPASHGGASETEDVPGSIRKSVKTAVNPTTEFARCFLRLATLPNYALDRLSRYEATLWRQARQVLIALGTFDRLKRHDRWRRFVGNRQELRAYDLEELT